MSISSDTLVGQEEMQQAPVRLRRPERQQMVMEVSCPDDLVGAEHRVRLVQAVVEKLDLSRFHEPIKARQGQAGRDATDPQLLVALWLYACICGIGSARELARRTVDSAAFRWLCGGVTVNHRLLSDFRTDHGAALDALFTQVIRRWWTRKWCKSAASARTACGCGLAPGRAVSAAKSVWRSCSMKRARMLTRCASRWTRRSTRR